MDKQTDVSVQWDASQQQKELNFVVLCSIDESHIHYTKDKKAEWKGYILK